MVAIRARRVRVLLTGSAGQLGTLLAGTRAAGDRADAARSVAARRRPADRRRGGGRRPAARADRQRRRLHRRGRRGGRAGGGVRHQCRGRRLAGPGGTGLRRAPDPPVDRLRLRRPVPGDPTGPTTRRRRWASTAAASWPASGGSSRSCPSARSSCGRRGSTAATARTSSRRCSTCWRAATGWRSSWTRSARRPGPTGSRGRSGRRRRRRSWPASTTGPTPGSLHATISRWRCSRRAWRRSC